MLPRDLEWFDFTGDGGWSSFFNSHIPTSANKSEHVVLHFDSGTNKIYNIFLFPLAHHFDIRITYQQVWSTESNQEDSFSM